ncbi:hypothetical protein [Pseudidiomarina sp. CB1]|uniref:hypothetical protein n=1 Tax=Pseudidiomarina sp. CB1 TaxID=2972484 RepID=UPI0021615249|nr:hypothetical protein [Pseudidiomarina sp. CB1]
MVGEFLSGISNRLKSPLFGYYLIAALLFNWDSIFFLAMDTGSAENRIAFVKANATFLTTIVFPLLVAIGYVLINPWVQFLLAKIAVKPISLEHQVRLQSEHDLLLKKQELEEARNDLEKKRRSRLETQEEELISRAKRDEELKSITDDDVRETVKQELEKLRVAAEKTFKPEPKKLDSNELQILRKLGSQGYGASFQTLIDGWPQSPMVFEYHLDKLIDMSFIEEEYDINGEVTGYSLTKGGRDYLVEQGYV